MVQILLFWQVCLGYRTDDTRIRSSRKHAQAEGLVYKFIPADLGDVHPNIVRMELIDKCGRQIVMSGCSVGVGAILLTEVNDYKVEITGQYPTLIVPHIDRPGFVARVAYLLAEEAINIAKMQTTRLSKGTEALMIIETGQQVDVRIVEKCNNIPGIQGCFALAPL